MPSKPVPPAYVRRFPRLPVDLRLAIMDERGARFHGRCSTLSEGGFGAVLAGELPVGAVVTVDFSARELQQEIRLMARVRHHSGFHHGFEFMAPSDEQRRVIAEFFHDNVDEERPSL